MIFFILNLILASETTTNAIKNKNPDAVPDAVIDEGLTYLKNNPLMFFSKKPEKDIFMKVSLEIKNCETFVLDEQLKKSIKINIEEHFKTNKWKQKYMFKSNELSANWKDVQFDTKFVKYILYILTEIMEKKNKSSKKVNLSLCRDIGHLSNVLNVYGKDIFKNHEENESANIDTLKEFKANHEFVYYDGMSILDLNGDKERVTVNMSDLEEENNDHDAKTSEPQVPDDNEPSTSRKTSLPKSELSIEIKYKTERKKEESILSDNDTNKTISGSEILVLFEIKVDFSECNCVKKGLLSCITGHCFRGFK